jgi:hypothetical protein
MTAGATSSDGQYDESLSLGAAALHEASVAS